MSFRLSTFPSQTLHKKKLRTYVLLECISALQNPKGFKLHLQKPPLTYLEIMVSFNWQNILLYSNLSDNYNFVPVGEIFSRLKSCGAKSDFCKKPPLTYLLTWSVSIDKIFCSLRLRCSKCYIVKYFEGSNAVKMTSFL